MVLDPAVIRARVAEYLDEVRRFRSEVMSVDSGVYRSEDRMGLLKHPESVLQLEAEFVMQLITLLDELYNHLVLAHRWRTHLCGLAGEFRMTVEECDQGLARRQLAQDLVRRSRGKATDTALREVNSHLHRIIATGSKELEALLAETERRRATAPSVAALAIRFGGPFLTAFAKDLTQWLTVDLQALTDRFRARLSPASSLPEDALLQELADYVDGVTVLIARSPFLHDEHGWFSKAALARSQALANTLTQAGERLRSFTAHPMRTYFLFIEHELAITEAILPPSASAPEWFVAFTKSPQASASDLLPKVIELRKLPAALHHARQALTDMEREAALAEDSLHEVQNLLWMLDSAAITKFLHATSTRLSLYHAWQPKLIAKLQQLLKLLRP